MTNSTLLRNLRVIALKLSKLFKIEFPAISLPKLSLRGITIGIGPIWGLAPLSFILS